MLYPVIQAKENFMLKNWGDSKQLSHCKNDAAGLSNFYIGIVCQPMI